MAEIKVTVSSTKPQKVSVSNNTIQHEVTASPDLAQYYSNISKNYSEVAENWATKTDGKVDGIEYSAKHYAQKAETLGIEALQNLEIAETQAIADVNVARDNAIIELNTTGQEQINTVSEKVSEAIEGVENAGRIVEEAIEDIQNTAEKNKKELQTISNEIKENAEEIANRTSLSMFDTILKDHVLTYEESKGLALQGTYVYKEAIAGSRYGYPDFYTKCLEEFQEATEIVGGNWTRPNLSSNGTMGGDSFAVSSNVAQYTGNDVWRAFNGVTSGGNYFHTQSGTKTGYIDIYNPVPIKITGFTIYNHNGSANRASSAGIIYGSDNGSDWTQITTYTNSVQTAGGTWNISLSSNSKYYNYYRIESTAGGSDSYWTINEIKISATQQLAVKHSNGHTFYDVSQKDQIDQIFSSTGMAWYYGVDIENERIFLPRNIWFDQVSMDEVGASVQAGLPNITSETYLYTIAGGDSYGAITMTDTGASYRVGDGGTTGRTKRLDLNASNSSPVYGNSNTVQPNAVKKLLYICVGNTESQSTVTDVVDVTTTENDTTPLFTGMYFDFIPNNVSWLKGGQQANSGGVYATTYNELVNELVSPKYGLKVIETKDMIAGIDYSEYWKINQDDMSFITPKRTSERILVDKKESTDTDPTWYNLYSDGWCEQGGYYSGTSQNCTVTLLKPYINNTYNITGIADNNSGITGSFVMIDGGSCTKTGFMMIVNYQNGNNQPSTKIIRWQASGYTEIPTVSDYTENINLYFKVANAVQNLELLNAGEVLEAVQQIAAKPHIIETYQNGTSGYLLYSNGWCKQWGVQAGGVGYTHIKTTLLKEYRDTNYLIYGTHINWSSDNNSWYTGTATVTQQAMTDVIGTPSEVGNKSTTGFYLPGYSSHNWITEGFLAEGEY